MSKSRTASSVYTAIAMGLTLAAANPLSLAAAVNPQAPSSGLIAAPAKVACIYDKMSPDTRARYQKFLRTRKALKREEDALDDLLNAASVTCMRQFGYSDEQFKYASSYMTGRLIFEDKIISLPAVIQPQIPQMFSEMPPPIIAGWLAGTNNVEKKYQKFLGDFMDKYKLDNRSMETVLDAFETAAIIRDSVAKFEGS